MSEQDKEVEKLKALKLHESCRAGAWLITKVPGGHIYTWFGCYEVPHQAVYVPDHTLALVRYENEPLAPIYREEKTGLTDKHCNDER